MKKTLPRIYKNGFLALLAIVSFTTSFAQCVPSLGQASDFALFTVSGAVGGTGISQITGNIGTNVGAITGFDSPTVINGTIYLPDSHTAQAALDLVAAFDQLFASTTTNGVHAPAFGNGETLQPGVYSIGGAGSVAASLTLDAQGNPDALFIFKIGGAFTTGAGTRIILTNGAQPSNIFWVADGAVAMAADTIMQGTLIANNGAISMGDQGVLYGRMYSTTGAVAINGALIDVSGVGSEAVGGIVLSDQSICSGSSAADLVLSGSSGTVVKWQSATEPTFATPNDIAVGSDTLTGSNMGNLTETTYFRAVLQKVGCSITMAFSDSVKITIASTSWTGTGWSNGAPNAITSVNIAGDFISSGNLTACTLTETNGANVIIRSGDTVTLNGRLVIAAGGNFKLQNDANLIQSSNEQNEGEITVERDTAPLKRLDYVLWSSPVNGQMLQEFSPLTLSNRFYTYNPEAAIFVVSPTPSMTSFSAGSACLIRMPNIHPILPTVWNGSFTGIPVNGNLDIPVTNNKFNAVGNPYPSGIDVGKFIMQNNITEALYFWRKTNNSNNSSFAAYTTAGGVSNSGGDPMNLAPGNILPVGEGFLVKATSTIVSFTNEMRVTAVDIPFLRVTEQKSRIWLDMTNTNGFFGQLLVSYMPEATTGIDAAIDGRFFNDSQTALTSMIGNEEFSIQGRPLPFDPEDNISLGFKSELADSYTIGVNHLDGIFSEGQPVYLKDNFTGTIADLQTGPYTFATAAGTFNNRFELVYQNPLATSQNQLTNGIAIVYKENQLTLNSGSMVMDKAEIFDASGRLLAVKNKINATETKIAIMAARQILIVKITSENNEIVTRKVAN